MICKVPMIRDAKQEPNSPPTSGSPIALAFGRFTSLHKRDYLKNQMTLSFQIPKLGSVFLPHKLQTFLKANTILNQTNA
ncbi:hypothetical protein [Helicobacter pylori]|uniref:hypothetical protein n=1 Tax=Helicobacter pylori TaxID=210 RepID=UPI001E3333A0|nr:hypothetical protein [Helicobacter pylori]